MKFNPDPSRRSRMHRKNHRFGIGYGGHALMAPNLNSYTIHLELETWQPFVLPLITSSFAWLGAPEGL